MFLLLGLLAFISTTQAQTIIVQPSETIFIASGDILHFQCTVDLTSARSKNQILEVSEASFYGSLFNITEKPELRDGVPVSRILFLTSTKGYERNDPSALTCVFGSVKKSVAIFVVEFEAPTAVVLNYTLGVQKIKCNAKLADSRIVVLSRSFQWLRDGVLVEGERFNGQMMEELHIERPKIRDAGRYECRMTYKFTRDGANVSESVSGFYQLQARPQIGRMNNHKLSEGETAIITCNVYGYPVDSIVWAKDKWAIDVAMNASKYALSMINYGDDTLSVMDLAPGDRGNYTCIASNRLGDGEGSAFVRVKDKYAVVWPLIGIVIEIALLAIIIGLCERRRLAKKAEAEAADEGAGAANSADVTAAGTQGTDLRQRTVNA